MGQVGQVEFGGQVRNLDPSVPFCEPYFKVVVLVVGLSLNDRTILRRWTLRLVRGCENFLPALAELLCLVLPGILGPALQNMQAF